MIIINISEYYNILLKYVKCNLQILHNTFSSLETPTTITIQAHSRDKVSALSEQIAHMKVTCPSQESPSFVIRSNESSDSSDDDDDDDDDDDSNPHGDGTLLASSRPPLVPARGQKADDSTLRHNKSVGAQTTHRTLLLFNIFSYLVLNIFIHGILAKS